MAEGVDRVERLETHANLVFLAGSEAWKIKRAVRFPYMDFSTLAKRHAACLREVEVNRRFAPELYLGCVAISRTPDGTLAFGSEGEIVEWAVHMRRFEQSALLEQHRGQGRDSRRGREVARRRGARLPPAGRPRGAAFRHRSHRPYLQPMSPGPSAKADVFDPADAARFQRRIGDLLKRAAPILDERARRGFVRRCHGDLHLANIVMWRGQPMLYDAIEFDEAIATVDTLYDLAFLLMDLDLYAQRPAANIVLNRYLWRSRRRPRPARPGGAAGVPGAACRRARHGDGRPGRAGRP